ncbi:MAG: hypothetical protein OSA95_04825 [Opitutales bacterium]|nr:hypothetical protein [Opitutales bacterium]
MNSSNEKQPIHFDDFLGLGKEVFDRTRLIILTGISGSGKTTALKFLANHHAAFLDQPQHWIWSMCKTLNPSPVRDKRLVLLDEIVGVHQLACVFQLLRDNQTLAVASHLHPAWFLPFRLAFKSRHFHTDHDTAKIQGLLHRRGISHTSTAISEFFGRHGASYVDLECILERHPGKSLDHALYLSQKLDNLTIQKAKDWKPVVPVLKILKPQEDS